MGQSWSRWSETEQGGQQQGSRGEASGARMGTCCSCIPLGQEAKCLAEHELVLLELEAAGQDREETIEEEKDREVNIEEEKDREVNIEEEKDREVNIEEEKDREVNIEEEKDREVNIEEEKDREVNIEEEKDREVNIEEDREVTIEEEKDREVNIEEEKDREVNIEEEKYREETIEKDREVTIEEEKDREVTIEEEKDREVNIEQEKDREETIEEEKDREETIEEEKDREVNMEEDREETIEEEGASHNQKSTSFRHPVTGQISPENTEYMLHDKTESRGMSKPPPPASQRPPSMVSQTSKAVTSSTVDATSGSKPQGSRSSGKVHSFGKRDQAIKRNPNIPVVVRGWLYKQDSSGIRLWKRKWFVLSDYCLFYYKDSREETVLGSIPLPSYVIAPVEPDDHISRKYAFKASHTGMRSYIYNKNSVIGSQAEHGGMRTYFFSADTQEDMNGWIRAMNQAALMQSQGIKREAVTERPEMSVQQAVPQTNHVNNNNTRKSPSQSRSGSLQRPEREEPPEGEIRLSQGDEERYVLEAPRKLSHPATEVEVEVDRLSPDTLPGPSHPRNGQAHTFLAALPPEQNGNVVYKRGFVPRTATEKQVQRKTALAQVEHWVKVQKGDPKSNTPTTEYALPLPRRTPPQQPKAVVVEAYQTLPKTPRLPSGGSSPSAPRNLPSDYKYAHDRLSHFRMSTDERMATKEGMVWQLYEWQQRQQFRHGSPTAPIYTGPDFLDTASFRVIVELPRSISVPPSPCEVPPSVPTFKPLSPHRPHTPSDRVTVRPLDEVPPGESPTGSSSPRRVFSQLSKTSQLERRSMPAMGYITHTVSAPSLHGKTPEELTLLLIQLRSHQAKMAGVHGDALHHLHHNGLLGPSLQADDTYMQLKKDLDYLDLKIKSIDPLIVMVHNVLENTPPGFGSSWNVTGRETLKDRPSKPVKIAESDVDVKLSRLCEQDKILQELETTIRTLKEDKDKLESVLDVSHQQMEQYRDQPAHQEKISYQQRLLQEDVVHIRAEISQVSTEMENAWNEYSSLERDVGWLRTALEGQMNRSGLSQKEKSQIKRELWRVEDVIAGLSSSKANYLITISSVTNPERKLVPSVSPSSMPSLSASPSLGEMRLSQQHSPHLSPTTPTSTQHTTAALPMSVPKWADEGAPPRPPLPQLYSPEDHAPAVPPPPRETSVIRHTSVRGLKRQSDERKRDREIGQYTNEDNKVELRTFLSEPELLGVGGSGHMRMGALGHDGGYQTLPSRGPAGSSSRLNQSTNISSYVTLRRGASAASGLKERPKSALERLYSGDVLQQQSRGRMSAEEQLQRLKRHQKALVRQRKRTLSQGERQASSSSQQRPLSADLGSWRREQEFDLQLLERAVQGEEARGVVQGEECPAEHSDRPRSQSDEWLTLRSTATSTLTQEADLETLDYDLDLSRELAKPQKVLIPERYIDTEPEEPLSPQEVEARHRNMERIKNILAKSSVQILAGPYVAVDKPEVLGLDSALLKQERIITMSYALASEASLKSKQVAAKALSGH
ncbi:pleckstrin homology domain-containing family A member 7-like isoform X5 [Salvelinus fontinalis]|uniref:pleckstrin homology domain-containing family A member 7-like isoform X5 n=1 Tax=Salvelinus fontinalis TaxID=8038 RepID=UPI002485A82A|nr:pleckstrin homology domain-containing family A member 7-like isoform X5 [Salvelinus fontinalis]